MRHVQWGARRPGRADAGAGAGRQRERADAGVARVNRGRLSHGTNRTRRSRSRGRGGGDGFVEALVRTTPGPESPWSRCRARREAPRRGRRVRRYASPAPSRCSLLYTFRTAPAPYPATTLNEVSDGVDGVGTLTRRGAGRVAGIRMGAEQWSRSKPFNRRNSSISRLTRHAGAAIGRVGMEPRPGARLCHTNAQ
jgi:hypothetical protein